MEPHTKMDYVYHKYLRALFILCGHDIFRERVFKPYTATYFMYALMALFFASIFKTIAYYDKTVVLSMIAFVGIALEVSFLLFYK